MGKQSKKISNKYRFENVNDKYIKVTTADNTGMKGENDIEIPCFTVDGEPWVRAVDIIKGMGKKAIARGAVGLLKSAGLKENKDYYITSVLGLAGNSAVMKLDTAIKFLEKLNVPLLKPEYYEYVSITMKNEVLQMMKDIPASMSEMYTLKNNRLQPVNAKEERHCTPPEQIDIDTVPNMELLAKNIMSQTKALSTIAETLQELKKDRADMAAMVDYLSRDIKEIKRQVSVLFNELV